MEEWHELEEFPDYAISSEGNVVNMKTRHDRRTSVNQTGVVKVSLYQGNVLSTRSVAVLVAEAFVEKHNDSFDTIIHLNGDKHDCRSENLMWRPRWFAILFHRQFYLERFHNGYAQPQDIENVETGEVYRSIKEVCIREGLYFFDVHRSCVEGRPAPPMMQEFRFF